MTAAIYMVDLERAQVFKSASNTLAPIETYHRCP